MKRKTRILAMMLAIVIITATMMVTATMGSGGTSFRPVTGTCTLKGSYPHQYWSCTG